MKMNQARAVFLSESALPQDLSQQPSSVQRIQSVLRPCSISVSQQLHKIYFDLSTVHSWSKISTQLIHTCRHPFLQYSLVNGFWNRLTGTLCWATPWISPAAWSPRPFQPASNAHRCVWCHPLWGSLKPLCHWHLQPKPPPSTGSPLPKYQHSCVKWRAALKWSLTSRGGEGGICRTGMCITYSTAGSRCRLAGCLYPPTPPIFLIMNFCQCA